MKSRHLAILILIFGIMLLLSNLPSIQSLNKVESKKTAQPTALKEEQPSKMIKKKKLTAPKKIKTAEPVKPIQQMTTVPKFAAIKDVKLKKATFFKFMLEKIIAANKKVAKERASLLELIASYSQNQQFSEAEAKTYARLLKKYREDKSKQPVMVKLENLKLKIDEVPASLILAQSANESAWGTSRFARKGNNYFGQWCYSKGCGLVPASRDSGATHEVAKFSSVQKSVEEYIYNINVGRSYKSIRQKRAQMRKSNQPIDSLQLATGLEKYSERGKEYVKEIQSMIRFNKLKEYD